MRKYVPKSVIEELESIKSANKIDKDVYAFNDIIRYCQIGREVEKVRSTIFPFIKEKKVKR